MKTKTLKFNVFCSASYTSSIEVPENMSLEDAIEYAQDNLKDCPIYDMEYVEGGDILDEESCHFVNK